METVAIAIGAAFLSAAGVLVWFRRPPSPSTPPSGQVADALQNLTLQVGALAADLERTKIRVEGLPGLWSEEADRAQRAAERVSKAERRAKARASAEEADGDDAAGSDADRGAEQGVLPMPTRVEGADDLAARMNAARRALAASTLNTARGR